jgi:hypothetical protein
MMHEGNKLEEKKGTRIGSIITRAESKKLNMRRI